MFTWLLGVGAELVGKADGLLAAASVLQERKDIRRQVKTQIIENHWRVEELVHSLPGAKGLFDPKRDLAAYPRTDDETHCVRLMLAHFSLALSEHRASRYDLPDKLPEDVRFCFSCPAWRDAWEHLREFQSEHEIAYVEKVLRAA
jgi:hypothetical protein